MQDKHVSSDDLDAWRTETRGDFKLRMLPGKHFFLQDSESEILTTVAAAVQATLR
jgi:surfactin synthase thioesterase subunit